MCRGGELDKLIILPCHPPSFFVFLEGQCSARFDKNLFLARPIKEYFKGVKLDSMNNQLITVRPRRPRGIGFRKRRGRTILRSHFPPLFSYFSFAFGLGVRPTSRPSPSAPFPCVRVTSPKSSLASPAVLIVCQGRRERGRKRGKKKEWKKRRPRCAEGRGRSRVSVRVRRRVVGVRRGKRRP